MQINLHKKSSKNMFMLHFSTQREMYTLNSEFRVSKRSTLVAINHVVHRKTYCLACALSLVYTSKKMFCTAFFFLQKRCKRVWDHTYHSFAWYLQLKMISDKNTWAWVSMVSYFKKDKNKNIKEIKILGAVKDLLAK